MKQKYKRFTNEYMYYLTELHLYHILLTDNLFYSIKDCIHNGYWKHQKPYFLLFGATIEDIKNSISAMKDYKKYLNSEEYQTKQKENFLKAIKSGAIKISCSETNR